MKLKALIKELKNLGEDYEQFEVSFCVNDELQDIIGVMIDTDNEQIVLCDEAQTDLFSQSSE